MKKIISAVVALLLTTTITMNAQQSIGLNLDVVTTAKIPTTTILKGAEFTINSVTCDMSNQKGYNYILGITTADGQTQQIDLSKTHQMPISFSATNKDEYWYARSIEYSLPSLASMIDVYSMRNKAETKANQFTGTVRSNAQAIEDPYLTSYINSLLVKINPAQRLDFFKYNFKVIVVKDDEPNAGIYPNGALVINAGMLARIHTEDELIALLCHEANHFICNHYLENLSKIQKRQTAATGIPYERRDSLFEKKKAPCVSYVAQVLYGKGRYSQAMGLAGQNIANGAGRGADYYIKGECLLASQDSEESNAEARECLLKARETYVDGNAALKSLIVADIRLGMFDEARTLLGEFKTLESIKEEDRVWADGMLMNIAQ